jgi:hypothetical protein
MPHEPIIAETTVPVSQSRAFVGFTAQMGEWWDPLLTPDPGSFAGIKVDPAGDVATVHDGADDYVFARVTTREPDRELVLDFWLGHTADHPSQLRVTFDEQGSETVVSLEHGGWDDVNGEVRSKYDHWGDLLERYAAFVVSH